jgi:Zn/Cd-binding protein ZinT
MKRVVFTTLTLMLCLFILNCENEPDNEPELAEWNGTWNALTNLFGEAWIDTVFQNGSEYVQTTHSMTVPAATIKTVFNQMLNPVAFKSCVIKGDTFTVYSEADAKGTSTKITYTFTEKIPVEGEEGESWYAFEGDSEGPYKYLLALPPDQDAPGTMLHFHFRYASTDEGLYVNPLWNPVVMTQGTTQAEIEATLKLVIEEIDWPAYASMLQ